MRPRVASCLLFLAGWALAPAARGQDWQELTARLRTTVEPEHRLSLATRIASLDPPLAELVEELRRPPRPPSAPPTGVLRWTWLDEHGEPHFARVHVPSSYDPARTYPVYVYLHGNVQRFKNTIDDDWWRAETPLARPDRIVVFPAGWEDAKWWHEVKIAHLAALLDRLRATYNVDENRCVLGGVSDGGTGTWYQALQAPTPWCAFLPFIGHPSVLNMPGERASGEQYPANLAGLPFFVINGRSDPKYPAASMFPYFDLFRRAGAQLDVHLHDGGHDVHTWPQLWPEMENFVHGHPRDPDPDRLVWRTDDPSTRGRRLWLSIDVIGPVEGDTRFDRFSVIEEPDATGTPRKILAFRRDLPSGQLEVRRKGNEIRVRGEAVRVYRLRLNVDGFDFARPIRLVHEGAVLFDARVAPSVHCVLEAVAWENDPSQLHAAQLRVDVVAGSVELVEGLSGR